MGGRPGQWSAKPATLPLNCNIPSGLPAREVSRLPGNQAQGQSLHVQDNRLRTRPFMFRPTSAQHRVSPTLQNVWSKSKPWTEFDSLTVKITRGIPVNAQTLDLWHYFQPFGELTYIQIYVDSQNVPDGAARLVFSPPPAEPFWRDTHWLPGNYQLQLIVDLDSSHYNKLIKSPVDPSREYPEIFKIEMESLSFGMMNGESEMAVMFEAQADVQTKPSIQVNLKSRSIEIKFAHFFAKPNSSRADRERLELFKFRIPLQALYDRFYEIGPASKTDRTLVISMQHPPKFYRRAPQIQHTHDKSSTIWRDDESWLIQTDVVYDHAELRDRPISPMKPSAIIDIGRWTTYKLRFVLKQQSVGEFQKMLEALDDFNVKLRVLQSSFNIVMDQRDSFWQHLDSPSVGSRGAESYLEQLKIDSQFIMLSYPVRYQLEVCVSQGCLNELAIDKSFIQRLAALPQLEALCLLESVADLGRKIYEPSRIFSMPVHKKVSFHVPEHCTMMRRVTVTPTMLYMHTPAIEITNRVVRQWSQHSDNFIRISFEDEKYIGKLWSSDRAAMETQELYTRIYRTLKNGVMVGGRKFEFLAFGNSQLRENGAFFFSPTPGFTTVADMRRWMGEFTHIKIPAKYAARIGQCFSTTLAIRSARVEIIDIPDVHRNGYCFTDGVGKISNFLAQLMRAELNPSARPGVPSCYQFRLGGCKGVLSVDPRVEKFQVHIRPSQRKFQAESNRLEIIRSSSFAAATLNRQVIAVLSYQGVADSAFEARQLKMLQDLDDAMRKPQAAVAYLTRYVDANEMTPVLAGMVQDGFMESKEPFVLNLLQLWRAWSIKYLREKARIFIEKGAFLLGVADEFGVLKGHVDGVKSPGIRDGTNDHELVVPEIFVQVIVGDGYQALEGICIVARNPSLHPGDIRLVRAVHKPELMHLRDVIVFPSTGDRDIPGMCSGGDLDGDDFMVFWDPDLLPTDYNHEPMDYKAPKQSLEIDHVGTDDVIKFFIQYMLCDNLGSIAHAHLAWADMLEDGVGSAKCIALAMCHSDAVDFNKTGVPAEFNKSLRPAKYPHYMEKKPARTYKSRKILGKLYDQVKPVDFCPSFEIANFDRKILDAFVLDEDVLGPVREIKLEYDESVRRAMAQHAIGTEFEIFSTFVMGHSRMSNSYKFHEQIGHLTRTIKSHIRDQIRGVAKKMSGSGYTRNLYTAVAAMYHVTHRALSEYQEAKRLSTGSEPEQAPLISFPWLFAEELGNISMGHMQPHFDGAGTDNAVAG